MIEIFGPQAIGQVAGSAVALAPDAKQNDDIIEVNQTAAIEIGRASRGTRTGSAIAASDFATNREAGRGDQNHTVASAQAACSRSTCRITFGAQPREAAVGCSAGLRSQHGTA